MKKQFLYIITFLIISVVLFVSCKKDKSEDNPEVSLFYGNWKTSYGDTITFSSSSRKNMLNYNSMSPAALRVNQEYTYEDNKLRLKDGLNGPDNFHFFQSFKWIQKGSIFEVQGIHWFNFLSSTLTYFTFTKIP